MQKPQQMSAHRFATWRAFIHGRFLRNSNDAPKRNRQNEQRAKPNKNAREIKPPIYRSSVDNVR